MGRNEIILLEDDINDVDMFVSLFNYFNIVNPVRYFVNTDDFFRYLNNPENAPLLIFVDIRLPGTDGLEVVKKLKANPATKELKVVVLTGLSDEITIIRAMEFGADAYSVKPLSNDDIIGYIKKFDLSMYLSDKNTE